MSTREFVRKISILEKEQRQESVTNTAVALSCALFSCLSVLGQYAPFGVSAAVFQKKRGIFALLGALAGYILFYTPGSLLSCAALLLAFGLRCLFSLKSRRIGEKYAPLICSLSVGLCSLPRLIDAENLLYEGAALVVQSLMALGFALVLSRVELTLSQKEKPTERQDILFLFLALSAALFGFSCLFSGEFNPIFPLVLLSILWSGLYGGQTFGGAVGAVCGGLSALVCQSAFFLFPFCLGGMTAGMLRRSGKAAAVTSLLVCTACSLAVCGITDETLLFTLELLVGCAVLLLLPDTLWGKLAEKVFSFTNEEIHDTRIAERLYRAGTGLQETAACIVAVSDKLKTVNAGNPSWVCESATDAVCSHCGLKNQCWNENYSETAERLQSVLPLFERFGRINKNDFPGDFSADCPKSAEMAAALNRFYGEYALKKSTDDYAVQMRGLLARQFAGLAEIVKDLAGEMTQAPTRDRMTARRIADLLENECIHIQECICLLDRQKRMRIELTGGPILNEIKWDKFLPRFEEAGGRSFSLPRSDTKGQKIKLTFREKPEYRLETAAAVLSADGEPVCGDQHRIFQQDGVCFCLISDGMGCGRSASVESKMTVSLMERLISAGFSGPSALSVVNWALMVKGVDERLATADLLCVDLYSGAATLMKAGAAPTFLRRGRDVKEIAFPSLPVGILTQIDAQTRPIRLSSGDLLVMVSDGALYGDSDWLRRELLSLGEDPEDLCSSLLRRAKARRPSDEDDDITVLCARLVKCD